MLLLAGAAFLLSLIPTPSFKPAMILCAVMFGVSASLYSALVIIGITQPWLMWPLFAASCISLSVTLLHAQENRRRRDRLLRIAVAVVTATLAGIDFFFNPPLDGGLLALLSAIYLADGLAYYRRFRRISSGVCTTLLGFAAWGLVWPVASLLGHYAPHFQAPPVLWNLPKLFVAIGMILTLLEQETLRMAREAERNRTLYDKSQCGLFLTNMSGTLLDCNDALARMSSRGSSQAMIGTSAVACYADPAERDLWIRDILRDGSIENRELHLIRPDGTAWIALMNAKLRRDLRGQPMEIEGALLDVTEHRRMHRQLLWQARHDPLTGLANRASMEDAVQQALAGADANGSQVAMICMDLDQFKWINDNHGHTIGDGFLRAFAQRLKTAVTAPDLLGRVGGDEFLLLLRNVSSEQDAAERLERVLKTLDKPLEVEGHTLRPSVSAGVAIYPCDSAHAADLRRHADHALYRAKEMGRDQYQFYSRNRKKIDDDIALERLLHRGLKENWFVLHYQPQMFADGGFFGVEALLRFQHPERGLLQPADFLSIAERNGLLHPLGEWVIEEACRQHREWQSQGLPMLTMTVNVSAVQFNRPDFCESVERILLRQQMPPEYLELEITESLVMNDCEDSVAQMKRLKELGIRIAVDDFGTGYSSLSYLHRLPIDVLKIDRSFIEKLQEPHGTLPIVEAIISLANSLHLQVVAEGIEHDFQRQLLRHLGAHRLQGYLYSQAIPGQRLGEFLMAQGLWRIQGGASMQALTAVASAAH
ncbi:PAS domain S-box/GGDEF/EAL domain protein [Acidobacterium capsulatum ATCC 51196]|uniref:PAS domain S-box/GGDEF/EAL domain protein n=2 Tax=Acidobacteriaceae TaxID=204434 RepID=C1F8P8_ACIC5|nr:PAS domain S-box/GGDEF/EAL domain protein [Acidobacterium capsulatum ATCC 51196]